MMHLQQRAIALRMVIVAAVGYVVVGLATATLAGGAATAHATTIWRLAGWLISLAIFASHLAASRRDRRASVPLGAFSVALAVALGAFVLAALGPVRTHWNDPHLGRVAVLSLVVWPVLTGLPAYAAALLGGHLIERQSANQPTPPSRVA
jgi:hypothetical protein